MNRLFLILFVFVMFCACKTNNRDKVEEYKSFVAKYMDQYIYLPDTILPIRVATNGNTNYLALKNANKFKIITSIDGSCHVCLEQLEEWNGIVQECDSTVIFLCFLNAFDNMTMEMLLEKKSYNFPLIFDYEHSFLKENNISIHQEIKTFLLDNNNKVLLVGSPIENPKMWDLYKKRMKQSE